MFFDSAKKSFKHPLAELGDHASHGYSELSNSEYLAKKFYNQRNFYIAGIVLYLGMVIPTIVILLGKIVKWDNNLSSEKNIKETKEVTELKLVLEKKEKDLKTLKSQVEGLQKAYNEKASEGEKSTKESAKEK